MKCELCQKEVDVLVKRINKFTSDQIKICRVCDKKAEDNIWSTFWKKPKFKIHDEVTLKANKKEGWPEELGVVTEIEDQDKYPGMYVVQVVETPLEMGEMMDGLREIHEDNMTHR